MCMQVCRLSPFPISPFRGKPKKKGLTHDQPATVFGVEFPPLDPAAAETARKQVKERTAALRELAPNMGAYVNEVRQLYPPPSPS
jgi:hypothetical protein